MSYPQALREELSGPVQIVPHVPTFTIAGQIVVEEAMEPKALSAVSPLQFDEELLNRYPLYYPDNRVLVWELRRSLVGEHTAYQYHRKNRWVVPYNKAMAATMGSNTATYMLGSAEQAKGALYYIMDYMVKDPTAVVNVLSLVNEARRVTNKYASSAEDCDTAERKATHFLTRIVNNVSTKSEIPATMATAALLGITSNMSSHHYQYVYIEPAITFVKTRLKELSSENATNTMEESIRNPNSDEHRTSYLNDEDEDEDDEEHNDGDDESPANNTAGELFRVNGKYTSIQQHCHYAHRGDALKTLCFQEYVNIINVVPIKTKKISKASTREGTEANINNEVEAEEDVYIDPANYMNARYTFRDGYILQATHVQMIKSAISVPILTGKKPPQISQELIWESSKQAQDCAEYYITLLVPWDIDTFVPMINRFDYEGFRQWCVRMRSPEECSINRCKFAHVNNMATKTTNAALKRKLFNTYRSRAATQWSDKDMMQAAVDEGALNSHNERYNDDDMDKDCDPLRFIQALHRYAQAQNTQKGVDYIQQQADDINNVMQDLASPSILLTTRETPIGEQYRNSSGLIISTATALDISNVKKSLSNKEQAEEESDEDDEGEQNDNTTPARNQPELDTTASSILGEEQNKAFQFILSHIKTVIDGTNAEDNMNLIVHGGPGVGKSTMAKELHKRLSMCRYEMRSCAPTGIAASLLIEGQTIHSLFQIRIPSKKAHNDSTRVLTPLKDADLITARKMFGACKVLLVDEASMIDPSLLHHIHTRLVQIKGCEDPFGGMAIVLCGDFFQLTPVKGTAFYDAVMDEIPDKKKATPFAFGRELLSVFKMIDFTKQYRSKDPSHTATINRMRTTDNPVDLPLLSTLKVLTKDDLKPAVIAGIEMPSRFATAPIVVFSNSERHSINRSQAQRFALLKGVPILTWKKEICVSDDVGCLLRDLLYSHEPDLTGMFVEGAPSIMNTNLNATSGLANGTPVVLHSLMFKEEDDPEGIRNLIANAEPGEIINVPVPHAVIVAVPHINYENWIKTHESLCEGQVVIPLTSKSYGDKITLEDQTLHYKSHPYDLAFSVTFHKIQGQTVRSIILDLNQRPGALGNINFHAVYVGLTRVEYGDDIRILPCHDNNQFRHLLKLKPKANLKSWLEQVPRLT